MEPQSSLGIVFDSFSSLLQERFAAGAYTTEDTVRYTFYAALIAAGGFRHTEVTLEFPHPTIPGAEIDTLIRPNDQRATVALEFKFDRGNPGGTNQNRTQRAGAVIADVLRLAKVPDSIASSKYFVYVTDTEMAGYFKNPNNRLHAFFDSHEPEGVTFGPTTFDGFSKTFVARVASLISACTVTRTFAADLPSKHAVRVWRVHGS